VPGSTWDPDQYLRFARERRRPFDDLAARLAPVPGGRVADLGCGPGELTLDLHHRLQAAETVGIDDAEPMLERARALVDGDAGAGVRFEYGHLEAFGPAEPVDVLFANASLQWVPDHRDLLARLTPALAAGGQLAFQVPANHDHPSHAVADDLGTEWGLRVTGGRENVLDPEEYATVLHGLGYVDVDVWLRVYGFELDSPADLVEWTKGTLLTGYHAQLDEADYVRFVDEYRRRLAAELGDGPSPYYYPFKRILAYGRRP
jgi:trans-aconitate 2-methyltransferase